MITPMRIVIRNCWPHAVRKAGSAGERPEVDDSPEVAANRCLSHHRDMRVHPRGVWFSKSNEAVDGVETYSASLDCARGRGSGLVLQEGKRSIARNLCHCRLLPTLNRAGRREPLTLNKRPLGRLPARPQPS